MSARLLILALLASGTRAAAAPVEVVPHLTFGMSWAPAAPAFASGAAPLSLTGAVTLSALTISPAAPAMQPGPVAPVPVQAMAPALILPEIEPIPAAGLAPENHQAPAASKKTDDISGSANTPDAGTYSAKFDGSINRDGSDGRSYVESAPLILKAAGGNLELRRYKSADGSSVQVSRRLRAARYEVRESGGAGFFFRLKNGVLTAEGLNGSAPVLVDAVAEFARAVRTFGAGARAIEGTRAEENGFTPAEATTRTWLGRQAAAAGFTRVIFSDSGKTFFVRPEDVMTDRSGGAWQRTKVRKDKFGAWARWEKDGRVIWLVTRAEGKSFMIAEYHGAEIPKSGTPARGLAVFSLRDGALLSHIDAANATLLDVEEARAKAAAHVLAPL